MAERWLFLGNPGVGKSTLLNCLAQRPVFRSGISYGTGLTRDVQTWVDHERGVEYIDTPGLADYVAERAAADAITRALRLSGPRLKLCFVVHLQHGGCVVGQDLVTIERVLDSIRSRDVPFAIIINCVSAAMCKKVVSDASEAKRLTALVNSGKYTTPHVIVIPEMSELIEARDRVVSPPYGMRRALEQFPTATIWADQVAAIYVEGFPAAVTLAERSVAKLDADKHALLSKQQELGQKRVEFWQVVFGVIGIAVHLAVGI